MRAIDFVMLVGFIFYYQLLTGCNMDDKFCQALTDNDRATLKIIFDEKLKTLNPEQDLEETCNTIKLWIEQYDCVSSAEVVEGVLRTEPPIKEFIVHVKDSSEEVLTRSIGIRLFTDKLRFNYD